MAEQNTQPAKITKVKIMKIIVAFQGEPGAYSEQALQKFFMGAPGVPAAPAARIYPQEKYRDIEDLPCKDFRSLFQAVAKGRAVFAVVPLENSLAGSIMENYDLLFAYYHDLCICGEIRLPVSHMLIAAKGSRLEQIQVVRSHPQALAQSSLFLERHNFQPVAAFDTAGAVKQLKENPDHSVAAIASSLAAEIYSMEILAAAIENNPHNYTRFAIVARRDCQLLQERISSYEQNSSKFGDKWSISLQLRNFPGNLATALTVFQKYELNLTKLESRPIIGKPWSYRFYLDTLISPKMNVAETEQEFFAQLKEMSEEYQIIGRYWENLD